MAKDVKKALPLKKVDDQPVAAMAKLASVMGMKFNVGSQVRVADLGMKLKRPEVLAAVKGMKDMAKVKGGKSEQGRNVHVRGSITSLPVKNVEVEVPILLVSVAEKPESHMTAFEKIEIIKEGVGKKDLEHLKEFTGLDYDQLAQTLSVGRATLIGKRSNQKFNQSVSERILSLADIYSYGYEVFEETERFNSWMFRSNAALGGQTPFDLLDNQFGREEVKDLIGRIEYGVHS